MTLTLPARFWTETEAGWGTRPDGYVVHRDEATAEQFISEYWARERERNPTNNVPSEYTRPSETSVMIDVSQDLYDEATAKGSVWVHPSSHDRGHARNWRRPVGETTEDQTGSSDEMEDSVKDNDNPVAILFAAAARHPDNAAVQALTETLTTSIAMAKALGRDHLTSMAGFREGLNGTDGYAPMMMFTECGAVESLIREIGAMREVGGVMLALQNILQAIGEDVSI